MKLCRLGFLISFPATILLTSCSTSHTFKAGDATINEKRVHASVLTSAPRFYRVELPRLPLGEPRQFRFSVRHSPDTIQLTHLFMSPPQGDAHDDQKSAANLPWEDAVLSLTFKTPAGGLIYSNRFRLGSLKWGFSQGDMKLKPRRHADRLRGWYAWSDLEELKQKLGTTSDYDTIVSVESSSSRKSDFIQLRGEEIPAQAHPGK